MNDIAVCLNIRQLCEFVMRGEMTPLQAMEEIERPETFFKYSSKVQIELSPKFVINILRQYLLGKKSSGALKEWALFILKSKAFITPHGGKDQKGRYAALWALLRKLSDPETLGKITPERARAAMILLESL